MNPQDIAKGFVDLHYPKDKPLVCWRDSFYEYKAGCYYLITDKYMKALITKFLQSEHSQLSITNQFINNIFVNVTGIATIPESLTSGNWLIKGMDGETCCFNNGLLHKYPNGSEVLTSHSTNFFTLNKLPYDYDSTAQCPNWIKFLNEIMENDADRITLIQQWFKYVLGNDLREQKFLLCCGEGSNGKSVVTEVLERLLGRENCSHVPLSAFGDKSDLSYTLDKKLNSNTESSKEVSIAAETVLKAYTDGTAMTFFRKYKDSIHVVPTAKVMISTNELPRFTDKTKGIWRRMLYLPFNVFIPIEKRVKYLADKLCVELPGIYNWAQKADLSNSFIEPEICKSGKDEYILDVNPAKAFLTDYYEYDGFSSVPHQEVYDMYCKWCEDNGNTPMNKANLGKEVKRMFPKVIKSRPWNGDTRHTVHNGLKRIGETEATLSVNYELSECGI